MAFYVLMECFPVVVICVLPQKALDVIRMSKQDQERVFKLLAAILWLGNITFHETDNENHIEVVDDDGKNKILKSKYNVLNCAGKDCIMVYLKGD